MVGIDDASATMTWQYRTKENHQLAIPSIENDVLHILETVSQTAAVRQNLDIALFDEHLLDSFGMMQLIVELSDALHLEISPAEVERESWSTPRKIIAYLENRLCQQQ